MKRKLNHRDKPIEILQRTIKKMKHKDPALFQWDIYFLSHPLPRDEYDFHSATDMNKEKDNFDQLVNNITDKKNFHRKGTCQLRAGKETEFKNVTLILKGDYLYYINDKNDDNLNLILLSEASLSRSDEKRHSFEITSHYRQFVIACKSLHDVENWISAIIAQIEHTKCKHQIIEFEKGIQYMAKEISKKEAATPGLKQTLAYLEFLKPEHGELLKDNLKEIHQFK